MMENGLMVSHMEKASLLMKKIISILVNLIKEKRQEEQ
jgi:hypothetical protein